MKYDIVLKNAMVLTPEGDVLEGRNIAVSGNRIAKITTGSDEQMSADKTIDCSRKIVMPGMIDGHTHTSQQLLRGKLADEYPMIWTRFLVPFESTLTEEDVYYSALLYCIQAVRAGITGFAESGGRHMDRTVAAVLETGMRAAVARSMMDCGSAITENMLEECDEAISRNDELYAGYHGAGNGRVQIYYGMRQVMTCTPELIEKIAAHAGERNTGIHAHLCEHRNEVSFCLERYQMRPTAFLDRCGLLGSRLVTAHNVALSEHDITLLTDRKVKMIHCPYANLINHGFPKTPRILEAGGCVGLGSDGAAYNSVDLFEEMRTLRAALISSSGLPVFDPEVMPVKTMLKMATQNGAAALGMEDCLGKVEEGCIAALITIDIRKPHIYPTNNYTTALVDTVTAQDVCDSIIDGQIVMEDRELKMIDEQAVMEECRIRLASINGRL